MVVAAREREVEVRGLSLDDSLCWRQALCICVVLVK